VDQKKAGQIGARNTKHWHGLHVCPTCGSVVSTGFYEQNGRRGGEMTKALYGPEYYSRIGRTGGRGNKRSVQ